MNRSLALLSVSTFALASSAMASNYPAEFYHQTASVYADGPMLFARASAGCGTATVLGYKNNGALAQMNPETIDAIIVATCEQNGTTLTTKTNVSLGREWHGTGWMSPTGVMDNLISSRCYSGNVDISVAFSANGVWDSRSGQNYRVPSPTFRPAMDSLNTHEAACGYISQKSWDFIIGKMGNN